jgi:hypothetical protein
MTCLTFSLWSQDLGHLKTFSVYFDTDRSDIREDARHVLDEVVRLADEYSDYRIELRAHTDSRGSTPYNDQLATQRAASVGAYLGGHGIQTEKTTLLAFGELNPAFSNEDDAGRQKNRRVDVVVSGYQWASTEELFSVLSPESANTFHFAADTYVELQGEQGTRIWVGANAFEFADGQGTPEEIEFHLKECYRTSDMILAGLGTSSDGRILETGGMLKIEARADGKQLKLKDGSNLIVSLPAEILKEDMQLFTAVPNEEGGVDNWQATGQDYRPSLADMLDLPPRPLRPYFSFIPPLYKPDLSGKPVPPPAPKKPVLPRKPRRESVRYNPGLVKRVLEGKKNIEERVEAIFEKQMEVYTERMERYEQHMIDYQQALIDHKTALETHAETVKEWEAGLEKERQRYLKGGDLFEAAMAKQKAEFALKQKALLKKYEAWQKLRDEKIAAFEASFEKMGTISSTADLNRYFYQVSDLGWINCDRFRNVPTDQRRQLAFDRTQDVDEKIYVVFRDMDSVLKAYPAVDYWKTNAVPAGAAIRVVGVKVENGKALLAVEDTEVGDSEKYVLDYRPARLQEIRKALEMLN